jgi:hypothetical protein
MKLINLQDEQADFHLIAETMDKIYNLEEELTVEILKGQNEINNPLSTICEEENIKTNNSTENLDCCNNKSLSNNLDSDLLEPDFDYISYLDEINHNSNISRETKTVKILGDMLKSYINEEGKVKDLDCFIELVENISKEPENSNNKMLKTFLVGLKESYEELNMNDETKINTETNTVTNTDSLDS